MECLETCHHNFHRGECLSLIASRLPVEEVEHKRGPQAATPSVPSSDLLIDDIKMEMMKEKDMDYIIIFFLNVKTPYFDLCC